MRTLGIDTSNYATSLAVFDTNAGEVVCDCKRFLPVREGQLGLRQSDALFHHTAALPEMLAELGQKVNLTQIEAVGVSARPRRWMAPICHAFWRASVRPQRSARPKAFRWFKRPTSRGISPRPFLRPAGQTCSAKKSWCSMCPAESTDLLHCKGPDSITCIGTSSDLYAGQAVDRLGVRLGYAFPAGIYVSQLAAACTENIKPKVSVRGTTCSLSGLQNQCEKLLAEGKSPEYVSKYCLLCVAETLRRMAAAALERNPGLPVVFAGGVMSSEIVRDYITKRMQYAYFVPGKFASDNAIGVSILAAREINVWPNTSM